MKLLVTGSNGQLGWELSRLSSGEVNVMAASRAQIDITRRDQITDAITQFEPDFVINAAAYTAVDKAEKESEAAYHVNEIAPALLAQSCSQNKIPLIHLSTDYVFDGLQQHAYREKDTPEPLGVYGASKLAGEKLVQQYGEEYIILRVSGVFSAHGHNFVKTILRLAQEKETLRIVADQMICPTSAKNIAEVIVRICENIKQNSVSQWGTYHYCNVHPTSWYDFAKEIIALGSKHKEFTVKTLVPITTAEYPTPAKRPLYSVLNCSKIQSVFNIPQALWGSYLEEVVHELMTADSLLEEF
jgi:dTDP-4-dehydrorhamnose reductase